MSYVLFLLLSYGNILIKASLSLHLVPGILKGNTTAHTVALLKWIVGMLLESATTALKGRF